MNKNGNAPKRIRPLTAIIVFPVIALLGFVLYMKTKDWAFHALGMPYGADPAIYWVWPGVFGFQTTLNQGALFGVGQGRSGLFALLSFVALTGILAWMVHSAWKSRLLTVTLGMITAGILGNLYDRLGLHGLHWDNAPLYAVRDWILVMIGSIHWPNFNIADSLLVCGTILLVLHAVFEKEPT